MSKVAIAIIQARMSSSRFPGKVLKNLAGKPIIWHIYKRAEKCKFVDKVIIATSLENSDDELADYCINNNLEVYRGSLNNVLSRFLQILKKHQYRYFVRITGDCPLIHPGFIDNQIEALHEYDGDFVWAPAIGTLFEGQGVYSTRSIFHVAENSDSTKDLEHVGSNYFSNYPEKFRIVELKIPDSLIFNDIRLTVDEMEDYTFFEQIYHSLWKGQPIDLLEVIDLLKKNPELKKINQHIQHKRGNIEIKNKINSWKDFNKVGYYNYKTTI